MNGQWPTRAEWVWILVVIICIIGPPLLALKQIQREKSPGLPGKQISPTAQAESNNGVSDMGLIEFTAAIFTSLLAALIFARLTGLR